MDYDVVKTNVANACRNYKQNDAEFNAAMSSFYKEGKKNPSVAKILLRDHIIKNIKTAGKMMRDAVSFAKCDMPAILYPEASGRINQICCISAVAAYKSVSMTDIFDETKYSNNGLKNSDKEEFDKKWAELYPKTGKIRERTIEADRISADKVKRKADWLSKINYAKTLAEYKNDYPKSFLVRYVLITNGQIEEGNVTSRVKGWFKRFSYKNLIKYGFGFKK